jgi:GAF domain-containing protein
MSEEQDWEYDRDAFVEAVDSVPALESPLVQQFTTLTRALLDTTTVAGVLERVMVAALEVMPGADVVSVTLRGSDGAFHTPVESDPLALELDQVQYDTGEGPCVEAARNPGPALAQSDDLAVDSQWPVFGPAAAARGMGSLLSTALLPDARPPQLSGALNVYSRKPYGFADADRHTALLLATHASLALAATRALTAAELQATHLRRAVDSRDVIGQAKGILMHRRGIGAEEAFDILRKTSQSLNVKLVDLAVTLATRHAELDLP